MDILCPKGHSSADADYCSECGAKIVGTPGAVAQAPILVPSNATILKDAIVNDVPGNALVCPDCGTLRTNPMATFCEICRYNFVTNASWAVSTVPGIAPPLNTAPDSTTADITPPDALAGIVPQQTPPSAVFYSGPSAGVIVPSSPLPDMSLPVLPVDTISPFVDSPALSSKWEAVIRVDPALYVEPDPAMPCPVDEPERVCHLDFAENLIGRRNDRKDIHPEINLRDPGASHRHAKLLRLPDGSLSLLDIGSTNGTLLNGVVVPEGVKTLLKDGDAITLGFWTRIVLHEMRS